MFFDFVPSPISIDLFHVLVTIAGAASAVRDESCNPVQGQELDEWHGEPCEVRPLLSLGPAMNVLDERSRTVVTKLFGRKVESGRDSQSVERCVTRIFSLREVLFRDAQDSFVRETPWLLLTIGIHV